MPSGYVRLSAGRATLFCDCAPVGPDYQPGHAHADTLSFELSLGTQRVFVNSGTSRYGVDRERERQRGTAAHNTVVIEGRNSSEVWSGFRVARRAHARLLRADATAEGINLDANHDGYLRLRGRNIHARSWHLTERSLSVEDIVSGSFGAAEARFHLHPQISAERSASEQVLLRCGERAVGHVSFAGAGAVGIVCSTWHPEFGIAVPSSCISARLRGGTLRTHVEWLD